MKLVQKSILTEKQIWFSRINLLALKMASVALFIIYLMILCGETVFSLLKTVILYCAKNFFMGGLIVFEITGLIINSLCPIFNTVFSGNLLLGLCLWISGLIINMQANKAILYASFPVSFKVWKVFMFPALFLLSVAGFLLVNTLMTENLVLANSILVLTMGILLSIEDYFTEEYEDWEESLVSD